VKSISVLFLFCVAVLASLALAEVPSQNELNDAAKKTQTPESAIADTKIQTLETGNAKLNQLKVNLNTAPAEDLEKLPGIGKAKAKAIVAGRPYSKIEDVMKVKGIKQSVFNKLKNQISVD